MEESGFIGVLIVLIVLAVIVYAIIQHATKRINKDWDMERGYGHDVVF